MPRARVPQILVMVIERLFHRANWPTLGRCLDMACPSCRAPIITLLARPTRTRTRDRVDVPACRSRSSFPPCASSQYLNTRRKRDTLFISGEFQNGLPMSPLILKIKQRPGPCSATFSRTPSGSKSDYGPWPFSGIFRGKWATFMPLSHCS